VGAGTWTDDQRQTVGEYLDRWLVRKAPGLKPRTVDTYRSHIEPDIRPELVRLKLRDLRPEHVYAMLQAVAKGRSAAMMHRVRATLRTALAAAVKERLLSWNPARDLDMPREVRKRVEPWTLEETGVFLDAVAWGRCAAPKGHLLSGVGEAAAEQRAGMSPRAASRADGHSLATNGPPSAPETTEAAP
jgi:site-specific recombinase XerC